MDDFIQRLQEHPPELVREAWSEHIPPSINQAYIIVKVRNRYTLGPSSKLKNFKKALLKDLEAQWGHLEPLDKTKAYLIHFLFTLEEVETKGWRSHRDHSKPCKTGRWVRRDVGNWLKFPEDVAAKVAGFDDSGNLKAVLEKEKGEKVGMRIRIYLLQGR